MRKLVSFCLGLFLAVASALPSLAALPQTIHQFHPQFANQLVEAELDQSTLSPQDLDDLKIEPGSQLRIYLAGEGSDGRLFFDKNGVPIATPDVSVSRLKSGRVGVEISDGSSDLVVENLDFGYATHTQVLHSPAPYIGIDFADRTSSTDDISFAFTVSLTLDGVVASETSVKIAGTMYTNQIKLYSSDSSVDLSGGSVAMAVENIAGIQADLGEGVSVTLDMTAGEKYYGVAWQEPDDNWNRVPVPADMGIQRILALDTINLSRGTVRIQSNITLHVYDQDGAYLGTTRDPLPLSNQYYLLGKKTDQLFV